MKGEAGQPLNVVEDRIDCDVGHFFDENLRAGSWRFVAVLMKRLARGQAALFLTQEDASLKTGGGDLVGDCSRTSLRSIADNYIQRLDHTKH